MESDDRRGLLREAGFRLPSDWDVATIGELLAPDRGISVGVMYPGDHDPLGVPLIKVADLVENRISWKPDFCISPSTHYEYRRTELEGGELLMTLVGHIGRCAIVPPSMRGWNAARAIAVMRFNDRKDAYYVRACLLSRELRHLMDVWSNTTVQQTLNLKEVRRLPIPWPSKDARARIVAVLSAFDGKIELNRRMTETLEAMAITLFKSWFVDFDPVRAKVAGLAPAFMNAETAKLFPDGFENANRVVRPRSWTVEKLGQHVDFLTGFPFASPKFSSGPSGVRLLRGINVAPGRANWGDVAFWTESLDSRTERCLLASGDIILAMDRPWIPVGLKMLMLAPHDVPSLLVQRVARLRATPRLPASLLYMLLSEPAFTRYLVGVQTGTTIPHISGASILGYSFVLPPAELVERFDRFAGPLIRRMLQGATESSVLIQLRDQLIPKLLSGELRVHDAERTVEALT